jgi:pentatricopeptide repeat protein
VFAGIDGSILIEAIVEEGKFRRALPIFDEMIGKGHLTLQKVDVITYR